MAIVQDTYDIPDDIATGLAIGLYRRIGSVIRYAAGPNKGQIVRQLTPVDMSMAMEAADGLGEKTLRFLKEHKKGTAIAVATVAVAGVGVIVCNKMNNYELKVVAEFRAALRAYIEAIREGDVDIDKIDRLMKALEQLTKHKDYKKICVQLSTEELEVLVGHIYNYTIKLAKDNKVELPLEKLNRVEMKDNDTIIIFQNYLKTQKKIFEIAG